MRTPCSAIDIDIEHGELNAAKVRNRVIAALAVVRRANPNLEIYVTFGTTPTGPDKKGAAMIAFAASHRLPADGVDGDAVRLRRAGPLDMGSTSIAAVQGLGRTLQSAYRLDAAAAYPHAGISTMNGRTDAGETVTTAERPVDVDVRPAEPSRPIHVLERQPRPCVRRCEHERRPVQRRGPVAVRVQQHRRRYQG